jgi:hypothetical protein
MLVFGYSDCYPFGYFNDLRALPLDAPTAWQLPAVSGTLPAGRVRHTLVYDAPRDRMLAFGGDLWGSGAVNQVWALSLSGTPAWTQLAPAGTLPLAREGHEAIYDPPRDRMVVYGAHYPPEDLWALEWGGPVGVAPPEGRAAAFALAARPNPAAADVTVEFALPRDGTASVRVYDVRGRLVRTLFEGRAAAGSRRLVWDRVARDGGRAAAGVYLLRLVSGDLERTVRLALVD